MSLSKKYNTLKVSFRTAKAGGIIVRQRGLAFKSGANVKIGKDYTLFALTEGIVKFEKVKNNSFVSIVTN